ncbi:DUF697 domain-containing protein [Noviherbaspirillum galbum]|uniref:DUF697 domain-containing protein n=1 Tax=Noviherbaspirillum galbum TaxID=2709383 RepID=A0A6B3SJU1_9BURK|nr:DUF697 domain-containing protein [Noviherbaspirillum galbum]NEX61124.1 DUF697 domain-containing protein [Noviherbaspirillum galbum]
MQPATIAFHARHQDITMTHNNIARFFIAAGTLVLLYLGAVLFSSILQLSAAADRVSPGLGQPVFWILALLFAACALSPVVMYFRFPKPLVPPKEASGPEHDAYLEALRERLSRNPRLAGVPLSTVEDIAPALQKLSTEANAVVRNTSTTVFASTALLKNGRLDGLVVLFTQARMIWKISVIYYQRPSPRQMLFLYSNVCAAALIADSLDDIDFAQLITPMVVSIAPSLKGAVPGLQGISNLLVNCIATGAANAFLTLRVGAVARQYCESIVRPSHAGARQTATAEAMTQIMQITKENSARIVKTVLAAAGGYMRDTADNSVQGVRDAAGKAADTVRTRAQALGDAVCGAFDSTVDNVRKNAGRITPWRRPEMTELKREK